VDEGASSVARTTKRLKALTVERGKFSPGRYADGENLYLVVDKGGAKRWAFIYRWKDRGAAGPGRLREMGLGSFSKVDLAGARLKAEEARRLLGRGLDPIEARKADRPTPTFAELADDFVETRTAHLRNDKSAARVKRALETYAAGLRALRVDAIKTDDVLKVLTAPPVDNPKGSPLWNRVPESAKQARGYIEQVLDIARVKGFRTGDNPARWRGHLDKLLHKPDRLTRGHHAAMAAQDVPKFVAALRERQATSALALEFLILTAARSGEVIGATWAEIDRKAKVWTIPADRMKAGREHRVPLSQRALDILETVAKLNPADDKAAFLFPGLGNARPLSNMGLSMLLRRMKVETTVHGFRSAFRDWAGEETNFAREVAEAALAHRIGDSAELAYRRGDALEKRRKLMDAWARFCGRDSAGVIDFAKAAKRA
jgi:integrase